MKRNRIIACCIFFATAGGLFGQRALPPTDQLIQQHVEKLDSELKINKASNATKRKIIHQKYFKNLSILEKSFQNKGDLKELVAVRKESKRFATAQVLEQLTTNAPPDLEKLQISTTNKLSKLDLSSAIALDDLAQHFDRSLERYQKQLTKKNKIEDATKIQTARDEAAARPEIVHAAALARQAEAQAETLAKQEKDPSTSVQNSTGTSVANKFKGSDKKRIGDRYKIFIKSLDKSDQELFMTLMSPVVRQFVEPEKFFKMFKPYAPIIQMVKKTGSNFRSRRVTIHEDGKTAIQIPYIDGFGDGKDMDPVGWEKVDGEWYLKFGGKKDKDKDKEKNKK